MKNALIYAAQHGDTSFSQLIDFLRIPSISTQPQHKADVRRAAEWLADSMRAAMLENVRLIDIGRHPLVYADWLHAGSDAPTVLIYGHYDVQPPEPLDLWETPPFEPDVREDYLYARGAADDKGQLYIHIKAIEAYLQSQGRLPVNVKLIIEGEEEIGSGGLRSFISANAAMLAADSALVSDTAMLAVDKPALVYGLRGNCHMLLTVYGPARDLHSGTYGGGIKNPLNGLAHILAQLQDERGHILIPGFHDRVRPLTLEERETLNTIALDDERWVRDTGAPAVWGEPEYSLVERISARPTLDVTGLVGGYTGIGTMTIIPASAHAKISMRLVPDQDPIEIAERFTDFVQALLPPSLRMEIEIAGASRPALIERDTPAMRAAVAAFESSFGQTPIFVREGGSIPVVNSFDEDLQLPTVLMGFGLPGDRIHSPNERFYVPNFFKGIETVIRYLQLLSEVER